jgi:hypothetical protein
LLLWLIIELGYVLRLTGGSYVAGASPEVFSIKRSCYGFLLFTIHAELNVHIKFGEKYWFILQAFSLFEVIFVYPKGKVNLILVQ